MWDSGAPSSGLIHAGWLSVSGRGAQIAEAVGPTWGVADVFAVGSSLDSHCLNICFAFGAKWGLRLLSVAGEQCHMGPGFTLCGSVSLSLK